MNNKPSQDFLNVSLDVGKSIPFWIQGTGGNTSIKENGLLFVKSSGIRLDQMTREGGYTTLDLKKISPQISELIHQSQLDDSSEKKYFEIIKQAATDLTQSQASMESGFHVLLPKKYVIHFHALSSVLMFHHWQKDRHAVEKFFQSAKTGFVEHSLPGLKLTQRLEKNIKDDVILLQNHGVILQSDSADILNAWTKIENHFLDDFGYSKMYKQFQLQSIENLWETCASQGVPMKIYFPDTAVFLGLWKKCMIDGKLPRSLLQTDRNLSEIIMATHCLFKLCPDLEEIDSTMSGHIENLPSEKYRQDKWKPK